MRCYMNVFKFFLSASSYIIICFLFLLPFVAYRCWYPRCVTCLFLRRGCDPVVAPVKPNKTFFRSVACNRPSSLVSIGNGYFVYYVADDPGVDTVDYNDISVSSEVYIFSRSRFGRFRSVDLSDRCLLDSIKKFIYKEV